MNRYYSQTKIDYDSIGLFLEGDLQIAPYNILKKRLIISVSILLRVVARRGESYTSRGKIRELENEGV